MPIKYSLTVPAEKIIKNMRYAIQVQIRAPNEVLMWVTDTQYLIDNGIEDQQMNPITLTQVPRHSTKKLSTGIVGGLWRVESINGAGVVDNSQTSMMFSDNGRISGRAGCNNYNADYKDLNGKLTIKLDINTPLSNIRKRIFHTIWQTSKK